MQNGNALDVHPSQQRLLTAGLALHEQGRAALDEGRYADALELLQHSETAFDATEDALLQGIDNVGLMLLDLVWAAHLLQVQLALFQ